MIGIEEIRELLDSTDIFAKELFESQEKMKSFLITLSKMYNASYSNILLLKSKREDISLVATKEKMERYNFHIKDGEEPLKIIKRIQRDNEVKFVVEDVFDISQTDAIKKPEKRFSKEYIETMLKGMCSRRGLVFEPNNPMANIESIVMNIRDNSRNGYFISYNVDRYARQTQVEIEATTFAVAKRLNVNTRNYNFKDICKWGIDQDINTLKESLKYIQKFTNYFVKDFEIQQKLQNIENENMKEEQELE
ncbi:MAG: hypothetical protein IJJ82_05830 [Clostridia bacterium]|nr:hypothetical protein [Clostridia bacterium]